MNVSLLKTLSLKPLTTAVAISSALVLSACGGSSDSSDSKEKTTSESNKSTVSKKSKKEILNGSWKGECSTYPEYNESEIGYLKIKKINDTSITVESKYTEFKGLNCNPANIIRTEREPAIVVKSEDITEFLEAITVINNDKFTIEGTNEDTNKVESITSTRISNSKYDAIPSVDLPDYDDGEPTVSVPVPIS